MIGDVLSRTLHAVARTLRQPTRVRYHGDTPGYPGCQGQCAAEQYNDFPVGAQPRYEIHRAR